MVPVVEFAAEVLYQCGEYDPLLLLVSSFAYAKVDCAGAGIFATIGCVEY